MAEKSEKFNPIDVQKALKGASYPESREDLAKLAKKNGADDHLVDALRHLPHERFDGPNEVNKDLGGR
ncbi:MULTISPECIES: DUF2795 domain-containing protein [Streptomycetaceae]|uniref:DUF2795 domain-containing protein n=1 Tax=Streptantibioticus cattleyicolor (strain ATCC 35852 / DSM 46488 / JCM 4925 / NBRC 14057 / NRRL 8057) TaxID=1003195 RepID=F8JRK2_STREN|nr:MULTISPECIES: DUF2795 domain-containing protein [Streptomycetaceae]AEW97889.1 hypothetical protein SCATT_55180 [Streptantibioticus cattleyicolor NRRL 8057 = DSM 46488]MYS62297.1 DUF2795 domain-containing protein [Streptomyces sp. SID5468]CCB78203.1 conserved protein of unknown function [Streptantibioticus cattleyicolor NRRL 8057 = DSM 46488]